VDGDAGYAPDEAAAADHAASEEGGISMPSMPAGLTESRDAQGHLILTGTAGDDVITVSPHLRRLDPGTFGPAQLDGVFVSDDSGTSNFLLFGKSAEHLTIRGGAGNDRITVDPRVTQNLHLDGGPGDDRIQGGAGNDVITGGAGSDYIDGGSGDDRIDGGGGNDVLYGGAGKDVIQGGSGDDYVEGGKGDDSVRGGPGNDVVSGGQGKDAVSGDDGNDVLYAGAGKDQLWGGFGNDHIYAKPGDQVLDSPGTDHRTTTPFRDDLGTSIRYGAKVDIGTEPEVVLRAPASDEAAVAREQREAAAFQDRTEDDIDLERSSPTGQRLLDALDHTGHSVTIQRAENRSNTDWKRVQWDEGPHLEPNGDPAVGREVTVSYKPDNLAVSGDKDLAPIEALHHELSHAYNETTGTMQRGAYNGPDDVDRQPMRNDKGELVPLRNMERQAVGLPNTGVPFDHDNDPSTPKQTDNPDFATERGLSRELGRELREHYQDPPTP
jgi:hypothetical protein